jgi:hypothetical protein
VIWIINAAVYWTYRSALRLVVETYALGAFISNDIIYIHTHRSVVAV